MPDEPPEHVGYLLPTRTHAFGRGYSIRPAEAPGCGEYRVAIVQGGKPGTGYYLEEAECLGFIGRKFLWVKVSDGECYETHVGADFTAWACTCKAGSVHRHLCKHAEVLWDAIHRGFLPTKTLSRR